MWNHSRSPEHREVLWVRVYNSEWARTAPSEIKLQQGLFSPCPSSQQPSAVSMCLLVQLVPLSLFLCLSLMSLSLLQFQMAPFLCSTHLGLSSLSPLLCDSTVAVLESIISCRWLRKPSWLNCSSVTSRMERSSWKWYHNSLLGDYDTFSISLSLFSPPLSVLTKKTYNANIIYNLRYKLFSQNYRQ